MGKENPLFKINKRLLVFLCMMVIGSVLILLYVCATGNDNQVFTDVVIEYTSRFGMNKSAERALFYLFPLIGAVLYTVIFFKFKWYEDKAKEQDIKTETLVYTALGVSLVINFLIYQRILWLVVGAIIVITFCKLKGVNAITQFAALYFILFYAILGIYRFYVFCGGQESISQNIVIVIATLLLVLVSIMPNYEGVNHRLTMALQLFVPLSLLMYLSSKYKLADDSVMCISVPKRVQAFIWLIILAFVIEAVIKLIHNWGKSYSLQNSLCYGTCVSIMAFNRYSGTGSIADLDLHHSFENVIGYSQIFELNQVPFTEYIPVSGMYSIIQGWFLKLFGKGYASYYYLTANLFYLAIIFLIVYLLRKQLKAEWVLFLSLFFLVTDYNRITLIVPIVLLLTWPYLIEKRNAWLKAWFLTSFVHGLYYPVFGAATCIGFLPMGIWQVYCYAKSGKLKEDISTVRFWLGWIICFIPVILGLGWLLGTAKHMLAMGSQTIYADGITRFGQVILDTFIPYMNSWSIRIIIYYLFSYLIIISIVWLSVALMLNCGEIQIANKRLKLNNPEGAFIAISIALMFLVSFSYTVVRFDVGDLYSRSDGMVKAAFVILALLVARYYKNIGANKIWVFAFSIFILSVVSAEGYIYADTNNKLDAYYTVPENDIYVNDTNVRLGECFIDSDTYTYISNVNAYVDTLDKDASYLGLVDSFGLDYLCNIKGSSVIEIFNTIKGYTATEETVSILRENRAIVGRNLNPDSNYYLYHWLVTSGEYVWNDEARLFLPNDGSLSKEEVLALHKNIDLSYDDGIPLGRTPGSWGSSFDTLQDIFSEVSLDYQIVDQVEGVSIELEKTIDGDEADFIYLDFGDLTTNYGYMQMGSNASYSVEVGEDSLAKYLLKKDYNPEVEINIFWFNDAGEKYNLTCNLDEGRLLIPIGTGTGWLLNNHSELSITATVNGESIELPNINTIKFLKLREVL